jgi:type IV pilus assembly protein PilV
MKYKVQRGIALLEALIAVVLFSLGILALVGMQAKMTKNVTQSKLRGEASFLANQLIGQMWVDQANLANYAITSNACTASSYANCTNWLANVQNVLPGGGAEVTVNSGAVGITLSWQLPGESEAPSQLQIDANITN